MGRPTQAVINCAACGKPTRQRSEWYDPDTDEPSTREVYHAGACLKLYEAKQNKAVKPSKNKAIK